MKDELRKIIRACICAGIKVGDVAQKGLEIEAAPVLNTAVDERQVESQVHTVITYQLAAITVRKFSEMLGPVDYRHLMQSTIGIRPKQGAAAVLQPAPTPTIAQVIDLPLGREPVTKPPKKGGKVARLRSFSVAHG